MKRLLRIRTEDCSVPFEQCGGMNEARILVLCLGLDGTGDSKMKRSLRSAGISSEGFDLKRIGHISYSKCRVGVTAVLQGMRRSGQPLKRNNVGQL